MLICALELPPLTTSSRQNRLRVIAACGTAISYINHYYYIYFFYGHICFYYFIFYFWKRNLGSTVTRTNSIMNLYTYLPNYVIFINRVFCHCDRVYIICYTLILCQIMMYYYNTVVRVWPLHDKIKTNDDRAIILLYKFANREKIK